MGCRSFEGGLVRRVTVVFFLSVASLGSAAVSAAQTESTSVLLILDASGSMNRVDGSGTPLIDGAKAALREIVHRLPPDANVGLRVYGHRTSNEDPIAGCVDTELVVPVGPIDRAELNAAIDSFEAGGFTPIGLSLEEAAGDLANAGSGTIILVSDGVDTCAPPDPCQVAERLAAEGFATQIHTVGFFLNDRAAADQLQCIADAGNGTFASVDSIDHFFEQLSGLVTEALEGPGRISPQIEGALTQELAPLVPWNRFNQGWPAFETDVEGTITIGETRWYAFDVGDDRVPNGHFYVSAHIDWQPAADPDEYLEVRIFSEEGVEVGVPHEVMGLVVESPQRLPLALAAEFMDLMGLPTATAVTGPHSAFPAWEFEPFFALTRERFYAAEMNGGVYELWKKSGVDPPLTPGRYYAAVAWSGDRAATSSLLVTAVFYPGPGPEDSWINDTPQTSVFLDDGRDGDEPTQLEMAAWTGVVTEPSETPLRTIEVMSTIEPDEPRFLGFHLDEGERLFVGYYLMCPMYNNCGSLREFVVTHESGTRAPQIEPRNPPHYDEFAYGYPPGAMAFRAPVSGLYTLEVGLRADTGNEDAILLGVFVYAPEMGMDPPEEGMGVDPPDDGMGVEPPEDGWSSVPRSVWLSFLVGLASVRGTVAG